ncbi:MAG: dihydrodipicolinate synthase family protein [Verrucomicrobia bacterium]|nr:dihydrodipicolinate synthase family protein [Verrucomicrobiota bacterium]
MENGIYAAALTPLRSDFECDENALTEHCLNLIKRGCKGVVLFGTTGEGSSFSLEEKRRVIKRVTSLGLDPKKIIIANGSSCLPDTIDLVQSAAEHGCLAALIAPPSFYKDVTEDGVLAFYRKVLEKAPSLPILLYHIPQFSGVALSINIVRTLCAEFPQIIGLKESEGNLPLTKAILENVPKLQVFVGFEKQIPEAVSYGASGSICGMANLWPELICSVYETGDLTELEKVSKSIEHLPFIPCFKALLAEQKGERWRAVIPPITPLLFEPQ